MSLTERNKVPTGLTVHLAEAQPPAEWNHAALNYVTLVLGTSYFEAPAISLRDYIEHYYKDEIIP